MDGCWCTGHESERGRSEAVKVKAKSSLADFTYQQSLKRA
jgi:hypothetical protein